MTFAGSLLSLSQSGGLSLLYSLFIVQVICEFVYCTARALGNLLPTGRYHNIRRGVKAAPVISKCRHGPHPGEEVLEVAGSGIARKVAEPGAAIIIRITLSAGPEAGRGEIRKYLFINGFLEYVLR